LPVAVTEAKARAAVQTDRRSLHLLQALRGVAAMMVIALHASTLVTERFGGKGRIWFSGAAGVDLFFVISGFVMALSSRSLGLGLGAAGEFMKRRIERVVPLYWLVTTFKVVVSVLAPVALLRGLGSGWHVFASYLFVPARNAAGLILPVVSVGWTLNFEMMFYALFALALACGIKPLRMLIPALLALALGAIFVHPGASAVLAWCDPIALEFLFGMLLYEAWQRRWRLPTGLSWAALLLGSAVIVCIPWGEGSLLRPLVWGLPALAVVTAAVDLEERFGRRAPRWALEIGNASYSIYLTHTFALPVLASLMLHLRSPIWRTMAPTILLGLLVSVASGVLVYRLVELPVIHFFRMRRVAAVGA
jgi:exopolysaccharide production protein ExoZ